MDNFVITAVTQERVVVTQVTKEVIKVSTENIGPQGTLKNSWKGNWTSGRFYEAGDAVKHGGSSYLRLTDGGGSAIPSVDPMNWDLLAERGTDGTGYVLGVGATSPLLSSGGQNPTLSAPFATGSNGGFLSAADWNIFSNKLAGNQPITFSGDATGSGTTSVVLTLPTINTNIGTWNNLTVNGKGQVTGGSNVSYLTGNQNITFSGDAAGSGTTSVNLTFPTINANVGTWNNLSVNAKGQVIAGSNVSYLTGNQSITFTGDATGSGTTSVALTLPNVNANVGTWNRVTVNAKGQVTAGTNLSYLTANQTITFTGDASGSGTTAVTLTLPNVNANIGTWNNVTVNSKGLVTGGSNVSYMPAATALDNIPSVSITSKTNNDLLAWNGTNWVNRSLASAGIQPAGAYLTGNQFITLSGDVTGTGTTSIVATLPNVNSTPGTVGSSTRVPVITTNAKGHVTNTSSVAVADPLAAETAAVSKTLHVGTVIAATIYDTSKDSDGGAWRKRCTATSWYKESINGVWLGQAANATSAWALSGAVTGAYFQNSTDGKFYTLGASSPAVVETFRGNVREFPAVVEIIAEASRVVIYDATKLDRPMWMVFNATGILAYSTTLSAIVMLSSELCIGGSNGVFRIGFAADKMKFYQSADSRTQRLISTRGVAALVVDGETQFLVSSVVNSLAITVLDTAPIDPATGLHTPTIAAATAGGVSVIKDNLIVVNSAQTLSNGGVNIIGRRLYAHRSLSNRFIYAYNDIGALGAGFAHSALYDPAATTAMGMIPDNLFQPYAACSAGDRYAVNVTGGLRLLKDDPSNPVKGMTAAISSTFNAGWMIGDIRGAWLADTVAETLAASTELITNGTFNIDTSGWAVSAAYAATSAVVSGEMQITATAANGSMMQSFPTVVGKTYAVSYDIRLVSGTGNAYGVLTNSTGATDVALLGNNTTSASVRRNANFVATATTTHIAFRANNVSSVTGVDNVSVKLAEADRSVKNLGLIVNGTLTKSAVASGANLVAYSGFSASNYLEQPYNSQLDFVTGDFCVMGWVNLPSIGTTQSPFSRTTAGSLGGIEIRINTTGFLEIYLNSSIAYVLALTSTSALAANTPSLVSVDRASSVLTVRVNGVAVGTVANSTNLTFVNAVTRLGCINTGLYPVQGSMALWRISATAPSADRIAYIYETERKLFEPNAQCTLAGTSNAVTSLAYDDSTDILHVGTDWGRSGFQGLTRIDSAATTVGTGMKLAASDGSILTCGTNAFVYQPAYFLREELKRKKESREALGKIPVFFDFDATASQTTFAIPRGYMVEAVYSAGTLKRIGSTKDYTITNDGFKEFVVFGTGLSASTWVSIMCARV